MTAGIDDWVREVAEAVRAGKLSGELEAEALALLEVAEADPDRAKREDLVRRVTAADRSGSFALFVKEFWECVPGVTPLVWNWHIDLMTEELRALAVKVRAGQPRDHDLVVNVPFGTSKSTVISVLFHCWVWTWFPEARFLCATHTDSLALDLATKARDVITSEKYQAHFPHVEIRADRASKEDYHNTLGGERKSCTVGGKTPTGRHVHFILVDDPIDPQGARSEPELETASRFMTEVVPSRVVDKETCPTVLVMQRIHPRDPTHVMIKVASASGGIPLRQICLPGELTDGAANLSPPLDELVERAKVGGWKNGDGAQAVPYQDGLLDPRRLSRRVLAAFFARLGRYAYLAQVLQNPEAPGGARFKPQWFTQTTRAAPRDCKRVRCWDRASTSDGGCYTAGVLMARDSEGRLYIEHVEHGQWEPNERNDRIVAAAHRDRHRYGPRYSPAVHVEAERGSTGLESFQGLARRLIGFRVREDQPTGSKDVRAEPWADQLAAMNVWLVDDGTWDVAGYIQEHLLFQPDMTTKRLGKYKDQVDASSMACKILAPRGFSDPKAVAPRALPFGSAKKKKFALVVTTEEELPTFVVEELCLLVRFKKPSKPRILGLLGEAPKEVMLGAQVSVVRGEARAETSGTVSKPDIDRAVGRSSLTHGLTNLVGEVVLECADLDPGELGDAYHRPDGDSGMMPADLIMGRDHGKKLWSFLRRRRDPEPWVVVLCDTGDRRAVSCALGICDVYRLDRTIVLMGPEGVGKAPAEPPNRHIYDVVKLCRETVL